MTGQKKEHVRTAIRKDDNDGCLEHIRTRITTCMEHADDRCLLNLLLLRLLYSLWRFGGMILGSDVTFGSESLCDMDVDEEAEN